MDMTPKTKQRVAHVLSILRGVQRTARAAVDFTAADLNREFRDLSEEDAAAVVKLAQSAHSARDIETVMGDIDSLLATHGVEAIQVEGANNGRYWDDTVALYCNTGDPYVATVIFDIAKEKFLLTDYASIVEEYETDTRTAGAANVGFNAAQLKAKFRDLTDQEAKRVVEYAQSASQPSDVEDALEQINRLLGTYGVETIVPENANHKGYWQGAIAVYCNAGDAYNTTVIYDINRSQFVLESYGDIVEEYDSQHEKTSAALHTRTHEEIAQHIIDSAWRNMIDTYGVDDAHVTRADIADYVECPPEWHHLSEEDRDAVYALAVSMVPA